MVLPEVLNSEVPCSAAKGHLSETTYWHQSHSWHHCLVVLVDEKRHVGMDLGAAKGLAEVPAGGVMVEVNEVVCACGVVLSSWKQNHDAECLISLERVIALALHHEPRRRTLETSPSAQPP